MDSKLRHALTEVGDDVPRRAWVISETTEHDSAQVTHELRGEAWTVHGGNN